MKKTIVALLLGTAFLAGCTEPTGFASDTVAVEQGYPDLASALADAAKSNNCVMSPTDIAPIFVAQGIQVSQIERVVAGMVINKQITIQGENVRVTHGVCA